MTTCFVKIETSRSGYSPDQCGQTATVEELIAILEEYDPELPVYLSNDDGYTYGSIGEWQIERAEYEGDAEEVE